MMGNEQVLPAGGPLSASLAGINMYMAAIIDQKPWLYDRSLVPLPWRRNATSSLLRTSPTGPRKLRIGVIKDDGVVMPHPPILRGLRYVLSRLESQPNIEAVEFPPFKHGEAWELFVDLLLPDGGAETKSEIERSGEPCLALTQAMLERAKEHSLAEVWTLTEKREMYRAAYARHWKSLEKPATHPPTNPSSLTSSEDAEVDVILAPVGPGCATLHGTARYWGYTSQWNLLDYPAVAFPTGLQCGPQDKVNVDYRPRNEEDRYNYELCKLSMTDEALLG